MGLAEKLGIGGQPVSIDWDLTPSDTFAMFESWGGKERIRNNGELHYYFYIDNWKSPARLCLMERGVKHAKILAHIDCPQDMVERCVARQGKAGLDQSYAIDEVIKQWLLERIIESEDSSRIALVDNGVEQEAMETGLPRKGDPLTAIKQVSLRAAGIVLSEEEAAGLAARHGFYDSRHNPRGNFPNTLVDNGDGLTVTDHATGIMWQRGGERASSATTRAPRQGEREGVDYHFISEEEFKRGLSEGLIPEHRYVPALGTYYGIYLPNLEKQLASGNVILAQVDIIGARLLKERYGATTIFIMPVSLAEFERRIRARNPDLSEQEFAARMDIASTEMRDHAPQLHWPYLN